MLTFGKTNDADVATQIEDLIDEHANQAVEQDTADANKSLQQIKLNETLPIDVKSKFQLFSFLLA